MVNVMRLRTVVVALFFEMVGLRMATALPLLLINDISQNESNTGLQRFRFVVSLDRLADPGFEVSFALRTRDGSARGGLVPPSDYFPIPFPQTFLIALDRLSLPITIDVVGDVEYEPDETFFVEVSDVVNAIVIRAEGKGTIVNDDPPPFPPPTSPPAPLPAPVPEPTTFVLLSTGAIALTATRRRH